MNLILPFNLISICSGFFHQQKYFYGIRAKSSIFGLIDIFKNTNPRGMSSERWNSNNIVNKAPSWENLDSLLKNLEPSQERVDFDSIKTGRGPSSSKAAIRLFDAPEGFIPEVTFYRDAAAWCPYCEKVWLQLEEKRIPYIVDRSAPLRCYGEKPKEFLKIQPNGVLPVANIRGRIISESNVIMQALEDNFPEYKPLLPSNGDPQSGRVPGLLKLERSAFSVWFSWLTSPRDSSRAMNNVLKEVDEELGKTEGPYFLGGDISLVDIMFTPFLERMAASLPYYKGFTVRDDRFPHLKRWYEAMDSREAYRRIKSDYYTHCQDLPPQIGNCFSGGDSARFADEIDGGAWDISKGAEACLEPMIPEDAEEAKREAARNILSNYNAVVRFAARGVSPPSSRPVSAPLADPYVNVLDDYNSAIDVALRHIVHALIEGTQAVTSSELSTGLPAEVVRTSLEYLRDRVGVPRDMSIHGARQLRAHCNWFIQNALR